MDNSTQLSSTRSANRYFYDRFSRESIRRQVTQLVATTVYLQHHFKASDGDDDYYYYIENSKAEIELGESCLFAQSDVLLWCLKRKRP